MAIVYTFYKLYKEAPGIFLYTPNTVFCVYCAHDHNTIINFRRITCYVWSAASILNHGRWTRDIKMLMCHTDFIVCYNITRQLYLILIAFYNFLMSCKLSEKIPNYSTKQKIISSLAPLNFILRAYAVTQHVYC